MLFIVFALFTPLFADVYKQEIVLIAVVPPASEVQQVISTDNPIAIANAIEDLYTDNGVVINLINMSPDVLDQVMGTCIHKIAEEMVKYMTEGTVDDQTILIAPYLVDASNAVKPE